MNTLFLLSSIYTNSEMLKGNESEPQNLSSLRKNKRESQLKSSLKNVGMMLLYLHCTSLVLRGEGLEVPGILQGLHLVADSPTEQADEVQAVQLEF